jgi:hypothetical protein
MESLLVILQSMSPHVTMSTMSQIVVFILRQTTLFNCPVMLMNLIFSNILFPHEPLTWYIFGWKT